MASKSCCYYFVRFVVFTLVILNIVLGILTLTNVNKTNNKDRIGDFLTFESEEETTFISEMVKGIASICLGLLLLYGAIRKNALCVLIYLVLAAIGVAIQTYRFFHFVVSSGAEVNGFFIATVIMIILVWGILYFVYLFYRELSNDAKISKTSRESTGPGKSNVKNKTDTCSV